MSPAQSAPPSAVHPVLRALTAFVLALAAFATGARGQEAVEVRAVAERPQVAPGGKIVVALVLDHGLELHSWPAKHIELPASIDDFAQRTTIEAAKLPDGVRLVGIQWPVAKPHALPNPDGEGTIKAPVYSGKVTAYAVLETDKEIKQGDLELALKVRSQSCNEQTCFPPKTEVVPVKVTVAAAPSDARNEPALFAGFDQGKVTPTATAPPKPTASNNSTPAVNPQPAQTPNQPQPQPEVARKFLGFDIGSSLAILFLLAIVGGAVLNLTPCVLPIIPIKVMTLVEHAVTPNRRVILGLWMAVGVVAFWVAVGIPMMFVSSLDPSRIIFGNWWVTFGLGLVIALMGLGIMGLFNLNLPQSVYMINPKASSAQGSFLFGVMTGVLGLPCFGFVAGGLLAGAATLPPIAILAIFLGLGIGMAMPYLVLSINPGLLKKLPRTGPGSDLVKQVLGFLLLAAAAFFFASSVKTFLSHRPWYGDSIQYWAAALFVLIAAIWLILRAWQISPRRSRAAILSVIAILFAWGAIAFAYSTSEVDRKDYEARAAARNAAPGTLLDGVWTDFDQSLLDKALAEKKVVFVDYTAPWCITCRVQKRAVLDRDPVRGRLNSITLLHANTDDPKSSESLSRLGRTGIPTYAIYGPGLSQPIILNSTTPQMVMDALDQAAAKPITQNSP